MKITFEWLKDHLNTNLKEEKLLEQLTSIGLEVESVENQSAGNELFKIAKIIKTEKHPNADRLKVCDVDAYATRSYRKGKWTSCSGVKSVVSDKAFAARA